MIWIFTETCFHLNSSMLATCSLFSSNYAGNILRVSTWFQAKVMSLVYLPATSSHSQMGTDWVRACHQVPYLCWCSQILNSHTHWYYLLNKQGVFVHALSCRLTSDDNEMDTSSSQWLSARTGIFIRRSFSSQSAPSLILIELGVLMTTSSWEVVFLSLHLGVSGRKWQLQVL
jgi:hypothetical protein